MSHWKYSTPVWGWRDPRRGSVERNVVKPAPLHRDFEVLLPEGVETLEIRRGRAPTSEVIRVLKPKDRVAVRKIWNQEEHRVDIAHVVKPVEGWVPTFIPAGVLGDFKCLIPVKRADMTGFQRWQNARIPLHELGYTPNHCIRRKNCERGYHRWGRCILAKPKTTRLSTAEGSQKHQLMQIKEENQKEFSKSTERLRITREMLAECGSTLDAEVLSRLNDSLKDLSKKHTTVRKVLKWPSWEWECKFCNFKNAPVEAFCVKCKADPPIHIGVRRFNEVMDPTVEEIEAAWHKFQSAKDDDLSQLRVPRDDTELTEVQKRIEALEEENWRQEHEISNLKEQIQCAKDLVLPATMDPRYWDTRAVGVWLAENGLEDYVEDFASNGVTGERLLALTNEDMTTLDVGRKHGEKILLLTSALGGFKISTKPSKPVAEVREPLSESFELVYHESD